MLEAVGPVRISEAARTPAELMPATSTSRYARAAASDGRMTSVFIALAGRMWSSSTSASKARAYSCATGSFASPTGVRSTGTRIRLTTSILLDVDGAVGQYDTAGSPRRVGAAYVRGQA